jgi:hypothetical protein
MQVSRRAFFGISASAATGTALGGLAELGANLAPALVRAQQLMWGTLLLFGVVGLGISTGARARSATGAVWRRPGWCWPAGSSSGSSSSSRRKA